MSERQKTPQLDRTEILLTQTKVNSTPQHHGTAEASSHLNSLTCAAVSPLVARDLSKAASVKVDDMLRFFVAQIVLDKTKPMMPEMKYLEQIREVVNPIVAASHGTEWGSPQYLHAQLRRFLQTKTEPEGYEPWVNFTNTALLLLKTKQVAGLRERNTEDDIIMQRTDPSYHKGALAGRKPDIAFLKLKRAQALHGTRENWDMIAKARAAAKPPRRDERNNKEHIDRGPDDAGPPYFDWSDVLFFSEHKFAKRSPKSLGFEDLLVLEELRAPPPSPPGQSFPTYDLPPVCLTLSPQCLLKAESGASKRFRDPALVQDAPVSTCWCISLSHAIAEDAVFVSEAVPIVDHEKLFAVQAGEYGLRRLNSWFGMTHSLGCLVLGPLLYICWFDREGLIGSSAIDVSKDLEQYLVLLFILQRFKDDEWGRLAALDDSTIHIQDKAWKVDAKDILHKPWSIIGRNTTVIGCSQQPPTSSQPNASAPSIPASDVSPIYGIPSGDHLPKQGEGTPAHDNERPIYDQTRPASHVAAEGSIPGPSSADEPETKEQTKKEEEEGHAGGDSFVVKFSWVEKTRIPEHEVYHKIEAVAQRDSDVEGHVPDLVAHHAFDGTSTSVVRDALGVLTPGSRLLVAIVFKRLDGTIRDLSGAEYWKVYWETFLCRYGLWTQGVYHRDISDGNLMYRKDKDTGQVIGVLADFDLSSLQGNVISNAEPTGTVPFMALSLLSKEALAGKVEHDYGHEAEAYFWVGVYNTAVYDNGHTVHYADRVHYADTDHSEGPAQWNSLGANAMLSKKTFYLSKIDKHIATPSQKDVWEGLRLLQVPLDQQQIFERPKEPNPLMLSALRLLGKTPETFDPSVQEPKAVRDDFLLVKNFVEARFPSLRTKHSTSSS